MEKLNSKIKELSTFVNQNEDDTYNNFNTFYDLVKNNVNMKKLIKSRNNLIFNNVNFWKLQDYSDDFWTTLQLCFLLNELNQDDKDNKFVSSLMRSLEKNNNDNNDVDDDINKINELVNNIDKN
jgi:hypothetical protein